MSSLERLELPVDQGTWNPMDEDMISTDPIQFDEATDPTEGTTWTPTYESSDRIELCGAKISGVEWTDNILTPIKSDPILILTKTNPIVLNLTKEEGVSEDCIDFEFESEEKDYKDRLDSYQEETGLTEAVQRGTGQLNGIPVAIGVMD